LKALDARLLAGAGLDVFEQEPLVPEALLRREDVVLLPHLGSATLATRTAMGQRVLRNLDAFFAGAELPDRVV
jgi:glyoxylate reductase